MKYRAAFSLVELSIVLVILGLLVGGILAGQSLIRASELRAVGTEYNRWTTAINAYRDKYFALPGDMNNAQSFWGVAANCPGTNAQPSADATTCNGDGDGLLENIPGAGLGNEYFRFWQHLSNAGLIDGTYSGVQGTFATSHSLRGFNTPASRFNSGCWSVSSQTAAVTGSATNFDFPAGNLFIYGKEPTTGSCKEKLMRPEEAWNLDTKLDDGVPALGRLRASWWDDCTNAGSGADLAAAYSLSVTTAECSLQFIKL